MFNKLFGGNKPEPEAAPRYAAYADPAANQIYHLLFCDDPDAYRPAAGEEPAPWQAVLFAEPFQPEALRALANDLRAEPRVRALACHELRQHGETVPERLLLGVVIEVGLDGGLDTLAAYPGGQVRYINQTGRMTIVEDGLPAVRPLVETVINAARAVVARIGPWEGQRLQPPPTSRVRFSFIVSDGLYFGEGPIPVMQSDPLAGPLFAAGAALLQAIVDASVK